MCRTRAPCGTLLGSLGATIDPANGHCYVAWPGPLNWADAEDLDFPGQSFVQMITTSHCSLHYFAHKNGEKEIYFDLYSCKSFDPEEVVELLDRKFGLRDWHGALYTRATDSAPQVRVIGSRAKEVIVVRN